MTPNHSEKKPKEPKHLMLVAGEASGDLHGELIINELKKIDPNMRFSGFGGKRMESAGMENIYDLTALAVIGVQEVLTHYKELKRVFNIFVDKVLEEKPDAVVLIDYPGFNLRLAKKLKPHGIKIIYYISPQIWAWREKRVHQIKKCVDQMLVFFPFEKELYAKYNYEAVHVGHPLIDEVSTTKTRTQLLDSLGLVDYSMTIGLLPGSRQKEIDVHLPIMLKSAEILKKQFPMLQFLVMKAPTISTKQILEHVSESEIVPAIVENDTYNGVNACDICIVTSGTATLETALLEKPMVIIYKTSGLTWCLAKIFVKLKHIGIVNIVAQKEIVPECIQFKAKPNIIAEEMKKIFTNELRVAEIKEELRNVRKLLGEKGASRKAATAIYKEISN